MTRLKLWPGNLPTKTSAVPEQARPQVLEPLEQSVALSGGALLEALGEEAIEVDGIELDPGSAAAAKPQATKVRGWAGRGPVGLKAVKPPRWLRDEMARQGWHSKVWRWATGAEWDGRPKTDATWFQFGMEAYKWSDRMPPRWSAYPRAARLGARWAGVLAGAAVFWGWTQFPGPVLAGSALAVWAAVAATGWSAADHVLNWRHRRDWVCPLAQALTPKLGYPKRTPHRRFLFVPKGFAKNGGQVEVALPPDFVASQDDEEGRQIVTICRRKLALADLTESWRQDGRNHFLILRPRFRKPIPAIVRACNPYVLELVRDQPNASALLGLGAGAELVSVNADTEAPHWLWSIASGGGKTESLKGTAAQFMHRGADCTILDHKYTSHEWARGIARIARTFEAIHLALVGLGNEGDRRNRTAEAAAAAGERIPDFRRHLLLVEEANATIMFLQLWWETNRRSLEEHDIGRYGDPAWRRSPAVLALLSLLSMGRERNINVMLVAQHATSNALGGPAIREQFSMRILGRASAKAWGMLAEEISNPPVCSRRRGRMYAVTEGRVHEFQSVLWTDEQARAWATSGDDVLAVPTSQPISEQGRSVGHVPTPGATPELVTLSEAVASGLVAATLYAIRRASTRDAEFPAKAIEAKTKGQPDYYHKEDLRLWDSNRSSKKNSHKNALV